MEDDIENTPAARHVLRASTEAEAAARASDLLALHRDPYLVTRTLHRWVQTRAVRRFRAARLRARRRIPTQRRLP